MARLMSDVDIAIRILPKLKDWPTARETRTATSDTLRDGGEALRNLFHGLDAACVAIENDADLSPQGIAKKREESCPSRPELARRPRATATGY